MMLLLSRYSRAALVVSTLPAIFRFPGDFVKVKPVILLIFRCCRVAWAAATDDEFPRKHVTHHAAPKRSMTWWQLGGFAYVNICGGPFGMESAVNAGGALLTLVTIGVLSVCWAMPQALMTAEMSTAFPVNGGLIVVRPVCRGFLGTWRFLNNLSGIWVYWNRSGSTRASEGGESSWLLCPTPVATVHDWRG